MFVNKYTCIIATHCEADPITHLLTKPGRPLEIATKAISPPSYRKNINITSHGYIIEINNIFHILLVSF
jgi:hypothetical protein